MKYFKMKNNNNINKKTDGVWLIKIIRIQFQDTNL